MLITLPPKKFYVGNVFLFNSKPTLSVEDPLDWVSDHWSQRQDVRGQMRGFLQDEQGSLHWGEKSHFKVISLSNTHSHFLTHSEHNSGKILPILPGNQDTRAFGPFLCWAHIYSLKMQVLHFSGWCWLISVDGVGRSPLEKQMTDCLGQKELTRSFSDNFALIWQDVARIVRCCLLLSGYFQQNLPTFST